MTHGQEKSNLFIVALKPANKPGRLGAEGSGANFKKGRRADLGALEERESLACQIGPKFKLCTRSLEFSPSRRAFQTGG